MKFTSTSTEVYEDEEIGVITIHFDDQKDLYLQFQGASIGFEEDYYDGGFVYMEVIDQAFSGNDCFEKVELFRDKILVHDITDDRIREKAESIEVSFDINDAEFENLKEKMLLAFRDCREKLTIN